ncbi:MAG: alpha/beta hydrolase [Paludibacter sp.]|nr:alpha/beta hydrolase [Paludibacter sp.]
MKKIFYTFFASFLFTSILFAQEEIKLYPNGPKDSNGFTEKESLMRADFVIKISDPRMYFYPAPKDNANGTAVLICPGGGYLGVSVINEGKLEAEWFNKLGVSAFVLYYRMPNGHYNIPMEDAQTALEIIHKNAKKWNIDQDKIGIMGFSAGGHLASTVGTHFKNKIQRPAFMILGYPVITMNKALTHLGSRENLLGQSPSEKLVKLYSNELQVTKNTPPAFIFMALDDKTVPVENSYSFYKALQANNVPAELHTFDVGGHGFGMRKSGIPADKWPDLLETWLKNNKLIN